MYITGRFKPIFERFPDFVLYNCDKEELGYVVLLKLHKLISNGTTTPKPLKLGQPGTGFDTGVTCVEWRPPATTNTQLEQN